MRSGNLFVVSGPSGSGKGTLVARLLQAVPDAWFSVSATTRAPRPGEIPGESYLFVSSEEFSALIESDGLLEWAEYAGNCYGTPRGPIEEHISQNQQVILDIELQGSIQIREKMPDAKFIFIVPPSMEELERRLRGRGTETEEAILRRLETARLELAMDLEYDKRLINDDVNEAAAELIEYVNAVANSSDEGNQ